MKGTDYTDLVALARHLRSVLADKARRDPAKSPFILLYAFNCNVGKDTAVYGL